jgi:hypothetical protein
MIAVGICALVLSVGAFVSVPKGLERVSFLKLPDRRIRLRERRAEIVEHVGGSYRDPPTAAVVPLDDIEPQRARAGMVAVRAAGGPSMSPSTRGAVARACSRARRARRGREGRGASPR